MSSFSAVSGASSDQEAQGLRLENERLKDQLQDCYDQLQELQSAAAFIIQGPRMVSMKRAWKSAQDLLNQKSL